MSKTLSNNDEVMAQQPVLYSDQELVTIAEFPDPATANVARASLEAVNVPVFLQGENANSLLPIAFEARLQVRPEDEAAARRILEEFERQPVSPGQLDAMSDEAGIADDLAARSGLEER